MKKTLFLFCLTMIFSNHLNASTPSWSGFIPKKLYAIVTLRNNTLECDYIPENIDPNENWLEIQNLAKQAAQESLTELRKKHIEQEIQILKPWWHYFNHGSTQLKTVMKDYPTESYDLPTVHAQAKS